jgi:hypothetical protein
MNEAFNCYAKGDMNCVFLKVNEVKNKLSNWQPNLPYEIRDFIMKMISINPQQDLPLKYRSLIP